jgi:hypothetical protein
MFAACSKHDMPHKRPPRLAGARHAPRALGRVRALHGRSRSNCMVLTRGGAFAQGAFLNRRGRSEYMARFPVFVVTAEIGLRGTCAYALALAQGKR